MKALMLKIVPVIKVYSLHFVGVVVKGPNSIIAGFLVIQKRKQGNHGCSQWKYRVLYLKIVPLVIYFPNSITEYYLYYAELDKYMERNVPCPNFQAQKSE